MAKEGGKGQRRPAKPHQKQEQIQGAEKRGCRNISGDLMLWNKEQIKALQAASEHGFCLDGCQSHAGGQINQGAPK
ncbi:hypothetical protein [uncultured Ottowia sp.]|uniref:hypothetical protein n=1 Tax=uncultured Ottowia sp. TaxID=543067 RepID=UPI0025942355|nr:hypothetical protein [uncultured Ottowia sp.]